jgi:hypothetical protein
MKLSASVHFLAWALIDDAVLVPLIIFFVSIIVSTARVSVADERLSPLSRALIPTLPIGILIFITPIIAHGQPSASNPQIEGVWVDYAAHCGLAGNDEVKIRASGIEGNEWGCEIIEGTISSKRWELKARCNEAGGYERPGERVPVSRVIIVLSDGRLTLSGDKPLSTGGKKWRGVYNHRCAE